MTTPGAPVPDKAFVLGSAFGSDLTETSAKAIMKSGTIGSFTTAQNAHNSQVKNPLSLTTNQVVAQAGSITGLEVRVTALEGGGTRSVYSSNFTWTNPGAGTIGVGIVGGGQAGKQGDGNVGGGPGGVHGSYAYKEFDCASLLALGYSTVQGTVGAGGTLNYQLGGFSSFGDLLVSTPGLAGTIQTRQGAIPTSSAPGSGGLGGGPGGANYPPATAGSDSGLARGGAAGTSSNGWNGLSGGSVSLDSSTPSGGGGGGGGAYRNAAFQNPGSGGPGGAPGGGGGGGGASGSQNGVAIGPGGPGANGRIIIDFSQGVLTT